MPFFPRIVTPKHQKLILQCYPGKSSEMKPNNAELSRLMYYATTRRTKLEKVCTFLEKKVNTDSSRGRSGHIQVTLYIVKELVKQCSDDIGVFAASVVNILQIAITQRDLAVSQLASSVYELFCQSVKKGSVLEGNPRLSQSFLTLTKTLVEFGNNPIKPNEQEWTIISLNTISTFTNNINPSLVQSLYEKSMTLILKNIDHSNNRSVLLTRLATHTSGDGDSLRRTKSNSTNLLGSKNSPVEDASINALKSFFDTPSKKQLDLSTKAFCDCVVKEADTPFYGSLIEVCVSRTRIELRYYVILSLVERLKTSKSESARAKISEMISHLLSSGVNMIGLPVKGLESSILSLQKQLVLENNHNLLQSCSEMIYSLANHIYYNDQITDMIKEIFIAYYEVYENIKYGGTSPTKSEFSSKKFVILSSCFADNVKGIIAATNNDKLSSLKRSPYPTDLWTLLFYSLHFQGDFLSLEEKNSVHAKWLNLYCHFLTTEKKNIITEQPKLDDSTTNKSENPLIQYFTLIDAILDESNADLQKVVISTTTLVVSLYGMSSLINFIPFALKWNQLDTSSFKHSLALYVLYISGKKLNIGPLEKSSLSKIETCKRSGTWSDIIVVEESEAPGGNTSFNRSDLLACLSHDEKIQSFISNDKTFSETTSAIPPAVSRVSKRALSPFPSSSLQGSLAASENGALPLLHNSSLASHISNGVIDFHSPTEITNGTLTSTTGGSSYMQDLRSLNSFNGRSIASKMSSSPGARDLKAALAGNYVSSKRLVSGSQSVVSNGTFKSPETNGNTLDEKIIGKSSLALCVSNLELSDDEEN